VDNNNNNNNYATSVAPLSPEALQDHPETIVVHDLTLGNRGSRNMGRSRSFAREDDIENVAPHQPRKKSSLSSSSCRDNIEKMAGSLSCSDFLERFGYRYCNHSYVKRNCCASHGIICTKTAK